MVDIITMHPYTRMGGVEVCACGASVDVIERRCSSSRLDERFTWWLADSTCSACGEHRQELRQGAERGKP